MRQLLLLTTSFPFGRGEDFLTEELRRAAGFDSVVICACHAAADDAQTKPVPEGMQVLRLRADPASVSYGGVMLRPDIVPEELSLLPRAG